MFELHRYSQLRNETFLSASTFIMSFRDSSIDSVSKIIKGSRAIEPDIILGNEGQGVQPLELVPQLHQLHVHEQIYEDRLEPDRRPRLLLKGTRADDGEVTRSRRRQDVLLQPELAPPPERVQVHGGRLGGEGALGLDGDGACDDPGVCVEGPEGVVACGVGAAFRQEAAHVQEAREQPGLDGVLESGSLAKFCGFHFDLLVVHTESLPPKTHVRANLWRIHEFGKDIHRGEVIESGRFGYTRSGSQA